MNIYVAFGNRLRQMRKEKGMSQEKFGKLLGLSKQVLSKYETYQRIPKINKVIEFATILGVSVSYMAGESD